ncbi:hypothetical protein [Nostoc sp. DedSLP04]|uniref:hypothetical protein n=1 Tax=Nostoc sp. DedSLP04 TaxID=3075401 RepID=UPI002AD53531|nr:hypothetical protein [Nostoc sp. DedSLP04]MDZ8030655.1 hypothetical protein [Nostoc sp. DedSLP04]
MTNVNELTQPNNQEAILEEIHEEELEKVVGGFLSLGIGLDVLRLIALNVGVELG